MKKMLVFLIIMFLLGLTAAPITAQQNADDAFECQYDLTGRELRFYHFGDLSGPFAPITTPVLAGFEDAIAYFNEQGGVCGATIATDYHDTHASGDAAQAAWDDFVGRGDAAVIFLYLTDDAVLLRQQAEEDRTPIVVAAGNTASLYGENGDAPAWVFAGTPLYQDQLGAFCDYISQHWDEYGIEGDPVIGHLSWFNAFGEASDTLESQAYCAARGVGYAKARYFFPGIPDITVLLQDVLDSGANILYTTSLASGPAVLANTVDGMGIRDQVVLAGPSWVLDTSVVRQGGESTAGFIGQLPYVWWDEADHPGIQIVNQNWVDKQLATAQNPDDAFAIRNIAYLLAWGTVDLYRQFMTVAVNNAGPDALNGQAVYDALTSGVMFSPLHGILTLQYADGNRSPHLTRIATIEFGETDTGAIFSRVTPLTDWVEAPDLVPGGEDVP